MTMEPSDWTYVHHPINDSDEIPAERKVVLVWLKDGFLPFCGYIRYAAGDIASPFFVVYHGNTKIGSEVVAWCDCLPDSGPMLPTARLFSRNQKDGRGFPTRMPGK